MNIQGINRASLSAGITHDETKNLLLRLAGNQADGIFYEIGEHPWGKGRLLRKAEALDLNDLGQISSLRSADVHFLTGYCS